MKLKSQNVNQLIVVGLLTWLIFLLYLYVNLPVPGPGEAYYLTKAKKYWDPQWVNRDFFLETSSTHQIFYLTWGWLAYYFDLPTCSIIGRICSMGILAWGLTRLVSKFCDSPIALLGINCLFLAMQASVDLADEWVIGGFEAKVIAYGLIFLAWSYTVEQKYLTSSMIMGFAINTHIVVGGWSLLLTVGSLCCLAMSSHGLIKWQEIIVVAGVSTLTAFPGVISTINALSLPDQAETSIGLLTRDQLQFHANYLLVFHRLDHHLDPGCWQLSSVIIYCLMLMMSVIGIYRSTFRMNTGEQLLQWKFAFWFSWGSLSLIIIGGLLGFRTGDIDQMPGISWRLNLLKFYWFRVPDIWIPLICSITLNSRLSATKNKNLLISLVIIGSLLTAFNQREHPGHVFNQLQKEAWLETCHWVKKNTPADKVFITPKVAWSFTWFTERREYVSFKNCPQDAVSLVEWNNRLKVTDNWLEHVFLQRIVKESDVMDLVEKTDADYLITWGKLPEIKTAGFQNDYFAVYRLK